ncbi:hypothetical protein E2C01_058181 [Portunus trituberculatus]|uniref:Uncharacterized protein n=1 Tax=Portunus trituberculatus TaxID=210409 RepID=A0A5B7GUX0_PORTR|nr:hypothetical protein [Portunus trituberculatus]
MNAQTYILPLCLAACASSRSQMVSRELFTAPSAAAVVPGTLRGLAGAGCRQRGSQWSKPVISSECPRGDTRSGNERWCAGPGPVVL